MKRLIQYLRRSRLSAEAQHRAAMAALARATGHRY
jgi:hypothetical protein